MRIDRIDQVLYLPEGANLYNTTISMFIEKCRIIIRKSVSTHHEVEKKPNEDDFCLPQWHALVRVLSGVDTLKREDSSANNILRSVITGSADNLVKANQLLEAKAEDQRTLMIDIIRPNAPAKPEPGEVFARLAWGVIGKHQPFVGINGGIGMALTSAEIGDELWIIRGCDQPMTLRPKGDHYLVVGEGSYDGANRGELLRDIPDDIKIGGMIGSYKFESICLR